jgi:hypothetical protein
MCPFSHWPKEATALRIDDGFLDSFIANLLSMIPPIFPVALPAPDDVHSKNAGTDEQRLRKVGANNQAKKEGDRMDQQAEVHIGIIMTD